MHKLYSSFAAMVALFIFSNSPSQAEPVSQEQNKKILELTKPNWVAFRDYNGRQLIYFTHLEAWKCGISQVSYGINGKALDQFWQLAPCDSKNPNAVLKEKPYLAFPLNSVQSIQVQLTYADNSKSDIQTYQP